jgi:hypothetical protein
MNFVLSSWFGLAHRSFSVGGRVPCPHTNPHTGRAPIKRGLSQSGAIRCYSSPDARTASVHAIGVLGIPAYRTGRRFYRSREIGAMMTISLFLQESRNKILFRKFDGNDNGHNYGSCSEYITE